MCKQMRWLLLGCLVFLAQGAWALAPASIAKLYGKSHLDFTQLAIKTPSIAENGATVPVEVAEIKPRDGAYVTEIAFFTDYRHDQPLASFSFGPDSVAYVSTRLKLDQTTNLYVVARWSDGRVTAGSKHIKITIGGCGGGSGYAAESVRQQLYAPAAKSLARPLAAAPLPPNYDLEQRERYAAIDGNPLRLTAEHPVSTFSIDVDSAAYANVRRILNGGTLPPADAVRVEEMINYFSYQYPAPDSRQRPFQLSTEMAGTPWNPHSYLVRLGLKGYEVPAAQIPPANLVFLVDVSGSMSGPNRLPLAQQALRLLTKQLRAEDRVSLVTYAGSTRVELEPTAGDRKETILAAIERLSAGGSTNGGSGIQLAYQMARQGYIPGGVNRVLIATDGDFNVGITSHSALVDLVKKERASGIALTTLGFGMGNYNDKTLEQLADVGNGNHAYIDTLNEARKVLVAQMAGTLHTIAKDVKIQVEFNPAVVAEYRLIGYENRLLKREDFNNDKVDAGDIGAGHNVTALYEVTFHGEPGSVDALRYGNKAEVGTKHQEFAWLKLRYKDPQSAQSKLLEYPLERRLARKLEQTSDDFRFAAAVAAFGQILRGGEHTGQYRLEQVVQLAKQARGQDEQGYRAEFVRLVELAQGLQPLQSKIAIHRE
jgi:Ca-activated chloride channel family protein